MNHVIRIDAAAYARLLEIKAELSRSRPRATMSDAVAEAIRRRERTA